MIDTLVQDAKKNIGNLVFQKFSLSENEREEVFRICKSSLTDTVKSYVFNGKVNQVVDLFTGQSKADENHPIIAENIANLSKRIEHTMNFDAMKSAELSKTIVPAVLNYFSEKFIESGKSKDMSGVADFLGFGGLSSVFSLFGKFK